MNAISLKSFHQSTSELTYEVIPTVSPIDFKLELCFHTINRTDAIDFGPSAKNKMAAIVIYKRCLVQGVNIIHVPQLPLH